MEVTSLLRTEAAPGPQAQTLAGLIAERAVATPDAPAILAPGRKALTYRGLERQVKASSAALAAAGFGEKSRIAVAMPNGQETAVALLAVMRGGTCVPLNPESDETAFAYLCKKLRADAVIIATDGRGTIRDVARSQSLPIVVLSFSPDDPAGVHALRCEAARTPVTAAPAGPDDIALVLHTSGTTGPPKAVPLTQRSQFDEALRRMHQFQLTARDCAICVTPIFTASALRRSLFPLLAAGGRVVCPPRLDADRMLDWITEFEPTFYAGGPAVHRAVLEAIGRRGGTPRHVLRYIISGSAALPTELHAGLEEAFGVPLIQTYAMSEIGGIAQNPLPPAARRAGSVGLPAQGEVAIVGDSGEFLDAGGAGEILVRGPHVFGGYENDPEANRKAFVGDWFRTGDVGYFDADGYLHITGRLKEIINRGGFKVWPAEVDAALLRHPAVAEAATFALAHPTLGEDVVAAVVLHDGEVATAQQVRDFAFGVLAANKVPSRIVVVDALPKTPLGKVRRHDLGGALGPSLRLDYAPPRNLAESVVIEVFCEVLKIPAAGALDNFFSLGGDSLRGAQVTARVNTLFACNLDATVLLRRPTVAEFAAEIVAAQGSPAPLVPPPIVALPRGERVPQAHDEEPGVSP